MKRTVILLVLVAGLVVLMAGAALAATRTVHSGFSTNSSLCASCHTMHEAAGAKLLTDSNLANSCIDCHDGTGSYYDVDTGRLLEDGAGVNTPLGGIFGIVTPSGVTSLHNADLQAAADLTAFGGHADAGISTFTCASCHDPHGNKSGTNARLLLLGPNKVPHTAAVAELFQTATPTEWELAATAPAALKEWADEATWAGYKPVVWHWDDSAAAWYPLGGGSPLSVTYTVQYSPGLIIFSADPTADPGWEAGDKLAIDFYPKSEFVATYTNNRALDQTATGQEIPSYTEVSDFCAGCHVDFGLSTSAMAQSGAYAQAYRHAVDVSAVKTGVSDGGTVPDGGWTNLGLETGDGALPQDASGNMTCLTCHWAHGTKATTSRPSSALLRQPDLDACQDCHDK